MAEHKEKGLVLVKPHRIRDMETTNQLGRLVKRFGRLDTVAIVNHTKKGTLFKVKAADKALFESAPPKATLHVRVEPNQVQLDHLVMDRLYHHLRIDCNRNDIGYTLSYEPEDITVLDVTTKTGDSFQMRTIVPSKNHIEMDNLEEVDFGYTTYLYDYVAKLLIGVTVLEESHDVEVSLYGLDQQSQEVLTELKSKLQGFLSLTNQFHQDGYFLPTIEFVDFYTETQGYTDKPLSDKTLIGEQCGIKLQADLLFPPGELKPTYTPPAPRPQPVYNPRNNVPSKMNQSIQFDETYI